MQFYGNSNGANIFTFPHLLFTASIGELGQPFEICQQNETEMFESLGETKKICKTANLICSRGKYHGETQVIGELFSNIQLLYDQGIYTVT